MTPRWTVYCHIHRESGRRYVGLTKLTMMRRWNQHIYSASRKGGQGCLHFWSAIRKYGKDAFDHEILEVCSSLEEANAAEEKWIAQFCTRDPKKGFNLAKGGEQRRIRDELTFREMASSSAKKMWLIPGMRERISAAARAHVFTEEHREKLAESRKGRTVPDEVREKISAAQRGKPRNQDSIAKSAASRKGIVFTPEHRRNIGLAQRGKKKSPEHVAKVAAANRARPKATHCKHGHSLEDAYVTGGRRFCKPCRLRTCASYHARRRAMAKAA